MVLSLATFDEISLIKNKKPPTLSATIPTIDLSEPDSKARLVDACEELGFFKVTNHGVPVEIINRLEAEVFKFFSLPLSEKEKSGSSATPFGYGSRKIGPNGDVGWIEYLLFHINNNSICRYNPESFRTGVTEYISAVRKLACEILQLLAEGLKIQPRDMWSKLLMDEDSDSLLRLNHYPPCPDLQSLDCNLIGFGEHTDPQIISVLKSNNTAGLEISLPDGSWLPVPPDQNSFFVNVSDSLKVLSNERFKSVRHRVLANGLNSRMSMIYFGAAAVGVKIAPTPSAMGEGEESKYKEFTWGEYKTSAYKSRLADNRLAPFEKKG